MFGKNRILKLENFPKVLSKIKSTKSLLSKVSGFLKIKEAKPRDKLNIKLS
jgi:hypothetical protein